MAEEYVSERLLNDLPRPLINFIWYLWEVYCDPTIKECQFVLQPGISAQRVIIPQLNQSFEQDFGVAINAVVLIRKDGTKHYMSRS